MTRRIRTPLALGATLSLSIVATGCVIQGPLPVVPATTPTKSKPTGGSGKAISDRLEAGVKKAITYKSREDKVGVMTEAFSLSKNKGMVKATESLRAMGSSLAGLQNIVSAQARPSGGAMMYQVEGGPTLRVIGTQGRYALAGLKTMRQGDAVIAYDEKTRELTSIQGKDVELRFKFDDQGDKRAWSSEIVRSPDGTTGMLAVEATSKVWKRYDVPQPSAPWACEPARPRPAYSPRPAYTPRPAYCPRPSYPPTMQPEGLTLQQVGSPPPDGMTEGPGPNATPWPSWSPPPTWGPNDGPPGWSPPPTWGPNDGPPGWSPPPTWGPNGPYEDEDAYNYPSCGPDPNWVAPEPIPFVVAGSEYPEYVDGLNVRLQIAPKGDESLGIEFAASLDEPSNVPNTSLRFPTHWKLVARVPGLLFDWESRLNLIPNNIVFEASGKMVVEVEKGDELFNYGITIREATRSGTFSMTNVGAKMKLLITGDTNSTPQTRLLSTEQGKETELGTVEMKPGYNNVALVRFNDGKRMEWELFPTDLFGSLYGAPGYFAPPVPTTPIRPVAVSRSAAPEAAEEPGNEM